MIFIYLVLSFLILFYNHVIFDTLIGWGFGWTISAITPWLLIFALSFTIMYVLLRKLRLQKGKWVLVLIPVLFLGFNFIINPIYEADYIKNGENLSIENHILLDSLNKKNDSFTGLVCIADIGCPFCKLATKKRLNVIKKRLPESQIYITLNSSNQDYIDQYVKETKADNIGFLKIDKSKEVLQLSKGVFPTFILISNGKIIYRWTNSELGYPALDKIESYLKSD
jgi:hypothetical protein